MSNVTNNTYIFLNFPLNFQKTNENNPIGNAEELATRVNNNVSKIDTNLAEPRSTSQKRKWTHWTEEETALLMELNDKNLDLIVDRFPGKTKKQIGTKRININKKLKAGMEKPHDETHTKKRKVSEKWTQKEINLLFELKDKGETLEQIASSFPNRTTKNIESKYNYEMTKKFDMFSKEQLQPNKTNQYQCARWTEAETDLLMQLNAQKLDKIIDRFPAKTKEQIRAKRANMRKRLKQMSMEQNETLTINKTEKVALTQEEKNVHLEHRGTKSADHRMSIDFLNEDVRPLSQNQGQKNPLTKSNAMSIGSILN